MQPNNMMSMDDRRQIFIDGGTQFSAHHFTMLTDFLLRSIIPSMIADE
jgi:hypothetical protein